MSEEKEILLGYLIGSISILRDMHIQFTEKSRNKLADKIMELLTAYEKQQKEMEELKEERKKYPIAMNDEQYKKVIELAQKDIKEELDRQINVRIVNEEFIENNFISKDKIKAKIEEVNIKLENYGADKINIFSGQTYMEKFKLLGELYGLQSLLEKE